MSIADLDPNYVLVVEYSKKNLSVLLAELGSKGISCECRPGHDDSNVYVFVRDDLGRALRVAERFDFVKHVTPLYGSKKRDQIREMGSDLIMKRSLIKDSDLVSLAQATGNPRVALYFAFAKTYTRFLMPLALFGLVLRLFNPNGTEFNTHYAIVVFLWAITFITLWKNKYEPHYTSEFGYLTLVPLEDSRVTFIKKLCFVPVALIFVVLLLVFQLLCFALEIFVTQLYKGPLASVVALLPTVLLSAYVPILTMIYNKCFVEKMTAWEGGVNPARSKLEKNFVFTFLTSYVPLLMTLFIYFPFGHLLNQYLPTLQSFASKVHVPIHSSEFKMNLSRYQTQFFYFTVTNQVVALAMDNILPIVMGKVMPMITGENKPDSSKSRITKLVSQEFPEEKKYLDEIRSYETGPWGEFNVDDNTRKLVLQFGFVVIFSSIWPLAPLVCICFNILFFKLDLWRALIKCAPLVDGKARRDVMKEDGYEEITMSPWNSILTFLTWFSTLVTPAMLLMYRNNDLPGVGYSSTTEKRSISTTWYQDYPFHYDLKSILLYSFTLEHVFFLIYRAISKILQAPLTKEAETVLPTEEQKEPEKLNLENVVNRTAQFMDKLSTTKPADAKSTEHDEKTTAMNEAPVTEPKTSAPEDVKTTGVDISRSENNSVKRRGPISPVPVPATTSRNPDPVSVVGVAPGPGVAAPRETGSLSVSKVIPNGTATKESSVSSLTSSSVAGATLPPTIPTSKNYDLRKSTPNIEAASVATISSVPRETAKPTAQPEEQKSASSPAIPATAPVVISTPVAPVDDAVPEKKEPIQNSKVPKLEVSLAADAKQFVSSKATEPEKQFVNENKVMATPQKQIVPENHSKHHRTSLKKDTESIDSTPATTSSASAKKKKKKGIMSPLGKLKKKF